MEPLKQRSQPEPTIASIVVSLHSVSVVDITIFMHMATSNSQFELISKIQNIEAQLKDTNRKLSDISESLDAQTQIKEMNLKKRVWEKNS